MKQDAFGPRTMGAGAPRGLTQGDAKADRLRDKTYPGQASWATEGPPDTVCRQCRHWTIQGYLTGREMLRPGPCAKFERMTRQKGPAVPPYAPSCRYFDPSPDAPPMYRRDIPLNKR